MAAEMEKPQNHKNRRDEQQPSAVYLQVVKDLGRLWLYWGPAIIFAILTGLNSTLSFYIVGQRYIVRGQSYF